MSRAVGAGVEGNGDDAMSATRVGLSSRLVIAYYRERLRQVQRAPRMWLLHDRYVSHVNFAVGMNEGTGQHLLEGFREFLQTKLGYYSSLTHAWLVLRLAEPDTHWELGPHELPVGIDRAVVGKWYELLDEFLAIREELDGLLKIHRAFDEVLDQGPAR